MKDKLEPNMYVRTKDGIILKVNDIEDIYTTDNIFVGMCIYDNEGHFINDVEIRKASHNIIDLIEVGDYVNGSEVLDFENKYIEEKDTFVPIGVVTENCYLEDTDSWIIEKNIKSVITHEQIEQMAYKVGK